MHYRSYISIVKTAKSVYKIRIPRSSVCIRCIMWLFSVNNILVIHNSYWWHAKFDFLHFCWRFLVIKALWRTLNLILVYLLTWLSKIMMGYSCGWLWNLALFLSSWKSALNLFPTMELSKIEFRNMVNLALNRVFFHNFHLGLISDKTEIMEKHQLFPFVTSVFHCFHFTNKHIALFVHNGENLIWHYFPML